MLGTLDPSHIKRECYAMQKTKTKIVLALLFCAVFIFSTLFEFIPQAEAQTTVTKTYYGLTSDVGLVGYSTSYDAVRFASSAYTSLSPSAYYTIVGQNHLLADQYMTYRSCFLFDTSDIPNTAVITSAYLSLNVLADQSDTDFDVVLSGTPTYPHNPPVLGDYFYGWYPTYFGSGSSADFVVNEYFNMTLDANGRNQINDEGTTGFMVRSSRDINGDVPALDASMIEGVQFYTADSAYKPMLIVTYVVIGEGDYTYHLVGPYMDNGNVADATTTLTVYPTGASSFTIDLTADGNSPDTYDLTLSSKPVSMIWNISESGNYSRVVYFTTLTPETIYITIPPPDKPFYLYSFTVNDFYGVSNGYLESMLYINGSERVIERQRIDAINALPFYMTWGTTYSMRVVSDNGTLTTGAFTALSDQAQTIVIPYGAFTYPDFYQRTNARALRLNESAITITYADLDQETQNLNVQVTYWNGTVYAVLYNESVSTQAYSLTWTNGLGRVNYVVNITAVRTQGTLTWIIPCPYKAPATNIFADLNALGDGLPMEMQYVPAVILIACAIIGFSFWHISAGAWIGWGATAFCVLVGWLPNTGTPTIVALGIAAVICAGITIGEFKKGERTL